jgi:hypothetical protein
VLLNAQATRTFPSRIVAVGSMLSKNVRAANRLLCATFFGLLLAGVVAEHLARIAIPLTQSAGTSDMLAAEETERHCLEVLHNGGEVELVAGAAETAKARALEAMLHLQVCKTHQNVSRHGQARFTRATPLSEDP